MSRTKRKAAASKADLNQGGTQPTKSFFYTGPVDKTSAVPRFDDDLKEDLPSGPNRSGRDVRSGLNEHGDRDYDGEGDQGAKPEPGNKSAVFVSPGSHATADEAAHPSRRAEFEDAGCRLDHQHPPDRHLAKKIKQLENIPQSFLGNPQCSLGQNTGSHTVLVDPSQHLSSEALAVSASGRTVARQPRLFDSTNMLIAAVIAVIVAVSIFSTGATLLYHYRQATHAPWLDFNLHLIDKFQVRTVGVDRMTKMLRTGPGPWFGVRHAVKATMKDLWRTPDLSRFAQREEAVAVARQEAAAVAVATAARGVMTDFDAAKMSPRSPFFDQVAKQYATSPLGGPPKTTSALSQFFSRLYTLGGQIVAGARKIASMTGLIKESADSTDGLTPVYDAIALWVRSSLLASLGLCVFALWKDFTAIALIKVMSSVYKSRFFPRPEVNQQQPQQQVARWRGLMPRFVSQFYGQLDNLHGVPQALSRAFLALGTFAAACVGMTAICGHPAVAVVACAMMQLIWMRTQPDPGRFFEAALVAFPSDQVVARSAVPAPSAASGKLGRRSPAVIALALATFRHLAICAGSSFVAYWCATSLLDTIPALTKQFASAMGGSSSSISGVVWCLGRLAWFSTVVNFMPASMLQGTRYQVSPHDYPVHLAHLAYMGLCVFFSLKIASILRNANIIGDKFLSPLAFNAESAAELARPQGYKLRSRFARAIARLAMDDSLLANALQVCFIAGLSMSIYLTGGVLIPMAFYAVDEIASTVRDFRRYAQRNVYAQHSRPVTTA